MALWKLPPPLTASELAARSAPGARSEGARVTELEGGSRLTWFECGDPRGAPLIALHGMGLTGRMFLSHEALFRARRLRCVAPTLLGGLADPPPNCRLADFATDVLRLADALGLGTFQVVGSSYGTLVALGLAALAPRRVERAGLFGPVLPGAWNEGHPELTEGLRANEAFLWSTARRFPALLYPLTALFGVYPPALKIRSFVDARLPDTERAMLRPGHAFHAELASLFEECGQRGYAFMALGTQVGWGRDPGFTLEQVDAGGAPLFLSTGERDNAHLAVAAEYLHRHVRRSTLELVPGQGRFGCMGPPFEAALGRFFDAR